MRISILASLLVFTIFVSCFSVKLNTNAQTNTMDNSALQRLFNSYDTNRDGLITANELLPILKLLGWSADTASAQALLSQFDKNGDGRLNINEFFSLTSRK